MKKYYISNSKIEGKGVFASRDIKKGEIVFFLKGKIRHRCSNTKPVILPCPKCANWIGIQKDTWIDPNKDNAATFINHSCDPNVGIRGTVTFCALKNIKKFEEICFDYSTTEEDGVEWQMQCNCHSKNCRGTIGGVISLPPSVYKRYLPYVSDYFQKIRKAKK